MTNFEQHPTILAGDEMVSQGVTFLDNMILPIVFLSEVFELTDGSTGPGGINLAEPMLISPEAPLLSGKAKVGSWYASVAINQLGAEKIVELVRQYRDAFQAAALAYQGKPSRLEPEIRQTLEEYKPTINKYLRLIAIAMLEIGFDPMDFFQ